MTYIAIDPGDTTGWATFDEEGISTGIGEIKGHDKFLDWLESQSVPAKIIVESYRARPGAINAYSKLPTVQLIGAIKRIAAKWHIEVIEQDPNPGLSIGLKFIGMSRAYPGKHVPNQISALAHGTYYLRKARIQVPK